MTATIDHAKFGVLDNIREAKNAIVSTSDRETREALQLAICLYALDAVEMFADQGDSAFLVEVSKVAREAPEPEMVSATLSEWAVHAQAGGEWLCDDERYRLTPHGPDENGDWCQVWSEGKWESVNYPMLPGWGGGEVFLVGDKRP